MANYTTKRLNLDGQGEKQYRVFRVPSVGADDYWGAVTHVHCPVCIEGIIMWAENIGCAGYRICNTCKRHFMASGTVECPNLIQFGTRRGW